MTPEGLQALPPLNDRDHLFIQTLYRQFGIDIHSREIFDTPLFFPHVGDIGLNPSLTPF